MKNIFLITTTVLVVLTSHAQIKNASFENWTDLSTHVYETEMTDTHNVDNPKHGEIDNWDYSFNIGISQTTDSYTGNYAAILHNWYNYVNTSLEYRDTVSTYPSHFTGYYKYIGESFSAGTVTIIVVSTAGDTVINDIGYFGPTTDWTNFSINLTPDFNPTDPADSIFITFKNSTEPCQGNVMTCNLLYIDDVSLSFETLEINELDAISLNMFPNPTDNLLTIQIDKFKSGNSLDIFIYNLTGKKVMNQTINEKEVSLDVHHLKTGSYIVKFISQDGRVAHRSLVVQ